MPCPLYRDKRTTSNEGQEMQKHFCHFPFYPADNAECGRIQKETLEDISKIISYSPGALPNKILFSPPVSPVSVLDAVWLLTEYRSLSYFELVTPDAGFFPPRDRCYTLPFISNAWWKMYKKQTNVHLSYGSRNPLHE
ncbi:hypothetical protein NPIL_19851 [Nephila pilipes]|uniref:Uncharacterized protein n=1 Tax=Nephila pilipes TaxID=299642 RepID=A0A8X6PLJ6_NEPPI|nr:hypothetical protein NPIL_19851 [Nephila pilipes]